MTLGPWESTGQRRNVLCFPLSGDFERIIRGKAKHDKTVHFLAKVQYHDRHCFQSALFSNTSIPGKNRLKCIEIYYWWNISFLIFGISKRHCSFLLGSSSHPNLAQWQFTTWLSSELENETSTWWMRVFIHSSTGNAHEGMLSLEMFKVFRFFIFFPFSFFFPSFLALFLSFSFFPFFL